MKITYCFAILPLLAGCYDTNIALNCVATASSSYDNNLTAQLLTDGIISQEGPSYIEVTTSEGKMDIVERENTIDGDIMSRNIIQGASGFIEYRTHGYEIQADSAIVVSQEALPGGRGGEKITFRMPVTKTDDGAVRLDIRYPRSARWRVKDVDFRSGGESIGSVLPSEHFSSVWMASGVQREWVMIDLGCVRRINGINILWLNPARTYEIGLSPDGEQWQEKGHGRARYVRIKMDGSADGNPVSITEIQVFGHGKKDSLQSEWRLQRASEVNADGDVLSRPGYDDSEWLPATVPATILSSYIKAGAVPDPDFGDNISQISESFFNSDFWYRHEFTCNKPAPGRRMILEFDGVCWRADIFLNGKSVGHIDGAFTRGRFDISDLITDGSNALAVLIHHNAHPGGVKVKTARWTGYNGGATGLDSPCFLASVGWDWITTVRGRNCGIWNDVRMVEEGPVSVSDPLVMSSINDEGRVSMKVRAKVSGCTGDPVEVEGRIGSIRFCRSVSEDGEVVFDPEEFPQLREQEMKLWWPNGYGDAYLYDACFTARVGNTISDSIAFKAGIRQITPIVEHGALKILVNGRRVVPMGGNWGFSQHNLDYSKCQYDIAVGYHKLMNMNMIRNWVGQIADEEFYDACDREGIMVWQDFWLANPMDGPAPKDNALFLDNASDMVSRIRRHPCLTLYCGRNEGYPPIILDEGMKSITAALHPDVPYISSSADDVVSGHGPYHAMPERCYFSAQSGKLHSERGLPNVPVVESLRKMMPESDLWPRTQMWGKHDFTQDGAQQSGKYIAQVDALFGECDGIDEFAARSQLVNYNLNRAIFESAQAGDRMGVLLWMTHSCWPSLVFCTYDYYFQPGGAFFGSKKACEPIHIQYNSIDSRVEVVNSCQGDLNDLTAELKIYDLNGNLLSKKTASVDSPDDSTVPCLEVEKPQGEAVYYLDVRLQDAKDSLISDNFYILGSEEGNLRALCGTKVADLTVNSNLNSGCARICIANNDNVPALFCRIVLQDENGDEILPVDYSDNYISLMPGDQKTVIIRWDGRQSAVSVAVRQLNSFI